jgi:putative thioredoxin
MLNTDELPALAQRFGVTSVPTVKFFLRGEVVHTIHGADPDSSFRQILDRFIAGDADRVHAQGLAAWRAGHLEQARMLLANAALAEPDKLAIPRDLAKILWSAGETAQALKLLDSLPPEARQTPEIAPLYAHLSLAAAALDAPTADALRQQLASTPDDAAARYQLAAVLLAADDYDAAMQELLHLAKHARAWRHDAGRLALLALFDLLGNDHALTRKYRQALSGALH